MQLLPGPHPREVSFLSNPPGSLQRTPKIGVQLAPGSTSDTAWGAEEQMRGSRTLQSHLLWLLLLDMSLSQRLRWPYHPQTPRSHSHLCPLLPAHCSSLSRPAGSASCTDLTSPTALCPMAQFLAQYLRISHLDSCPSLPV